jgi:flavorubredoxin
LPVGIVYSTDKKVIEKLARGLQKGLEEQGEIVKIYPDNSNTFRELAPCDHLFVGAYKTSTFKTKTPQRLRDALHKIPGLAGKRSIAFIAKGGMGERKALLALMNDMEKQGCFMVDQHSFASEKEAYEFGKSIRLRKRR